MTWRHSWIATVILGLLVYSLPPSPAPAADHPDLGKHVYNACARGRNDPSKHIAFANQMGYAYMATFGASWNETGDCVTHFQVVGSSVLMTATGQTGVGYIITLNAAYPDTTPPAASYSLTGQ